MNHLGTKALETPRLILRPFTMDDAPAMYKNWASDPEVTKFLTWQPHRDESVALEILALWTDQYSDPTFYQWAIELKEIREPERAHRRRGDRLLHRPELVGPGRHR